MLERLTAAVHVEDELGDLAVVPLVGGVGEREDEVETGDERGREIDLRGQGVRVLVEPSLLGVGGRQHGAPALEGSGDSRLGDGDLLRLHGLVERGPVLLGHLVKLVDACETLVRQDQGSGLEGVSVPSEIVLDGRGGQTGGGRRLTGREDSPGGEVAHVTQDLGLGDSGVSDQQDVGVSPGSGAVVVHLVASSEELQGDGLLDLGHTVDGGGDGGHDVLEEQGVPRHLLDGELVLVGDVDLVVLVLLEFHRQHVEVDLEDG